MNLNDIQLPDFIIGEWYKDALLPLPGGRITPAAPASTTASKTTAPPPTAAPPATTAPSSQSVPPPPKPTTPAAQPPKAAPPAQPAAPPTPPAAPTTATQTPPATPAATTPATSTSPDTPYKILGNNRRRTTLLIQSPGYPFLPDNQLAFLTKILEACRMTIADVAIVNNAAAPVNITAIKQQLQPSKLILFGLEPTAIRLPINFPHFKPIAYDDCTYLSAPALDLLVPNTEEAKLLKSKLWVCLKTLFDV